VATSATATRQPSVSNRVEVEYALYRIIAGNVGEVCKAIAYLGMGGSRRVEAVEGESVDAAVSLIKEMLDRRLAELRRRRREGIPTSVEFHEAFAALPPKMWETVIELLSSPARTVPAPVAMDDLSRHSNLDSATVMSELQKLGRKLAALLDFEPQHQKVDKRFLPLLVLASIEDMDEQGMPVLTFHEELRETIRNLPPQRPQPRLVGTR
jgi:hypothetical protein